MAPSAERVKRAQPALLATFVLVGHAALSSVAWVPEYIDRLGVSFSEWGAILGFAVVGAIVPLMFASRFVVRYGTRPLMRIGLVVAMVFLIGLGLITDPILWALCNMAFTFCLTFMGNAVNTHGVVIQAHVPRPIVTRLHAGWSIGAVLAALTGGVATVVIELEVYLVIVAVFTLVAFEFLRPHLLGPDEDGHEADGASHVKRRFWQVPGQLWILSFGLIAAGYPEFAVVDWATVFARDVLEVELALRTIPFATFMAGMIVGRLSMTTLAKRSHPHTIASWGAAIAAVTMLLTIFGAGQVAQLSPIAGLIVLSAGWLLVGLGLSGVAPTFIAAAAHIPKVSTAWSLSRMQLITQFAMIGAKSLMGALAENFSVSIAFLFPVVLLVAAAVIARTTTELAESSELNASAPSTGSITLPVIADWDSGQDARRN